MGAENEGYPIFHYIGGVPTLGCIGSVPTGELVLPSLKTAKDCGGSPSQHWMLDLLLSQKHGAHAACACPAARSLLASRSCHWLVKEIGYQWRNSCIDPRGSPGYFST